MKLKTIACLLLLLICMESVVLTHVKIRHTKKIKTEKTERLHKPKYTKFNDEDVDISMSDDDVDLSFSLDDGAKSLVDVSETSPAKSMFKKLVSLVTDNAIPFLTGLLSNWFATIDPLIAILNKSEDEKCKVAQLWTDLKNAYDENKIQKNAKIAKVLDDNWANLTPAQKYEKCKAEKEAARAKLTALKKKNKKYSNKSFFKAVFDKIKDLGSKDEIYYDDDNYEDIENMALLGAVDVTDENVRGTYYSFLDNLNFVSGLKCTNFKNMPGPDANVGLGLLEIVDVIKPFFTKIKNCVTAATDFKDLVVGIVKDITMLTAGTATNFIIQGLTMGLSGAMKGGYYIVKTAYYAYKAWTEYKKKLDTDKSARKAFALAMGKAVGSAIKIVLSFILGKKKRKMM